MEEYIKKQQKEGLYTNRLKNEICTKWLCSSHLVFFYYQKKNTTLILNRWIDCAYGLVALKTTKLLKNFQIDLCDFFSFANQNYIIYIIHKRCKCL